MVTWAVGVLSWGLKAQADQVHVREGVSGPHFPGQIGKGGARPWAAMRRVSMILFARYYGWGSVD
jgi:hypothetical protein